MAISQPVYVPNDIPKIAKEYNLEPLQVYNLSSYAKAAQDTAYCPYSEFRVGATLLLADGSFVSGANVENASYPVGICAERVAIAKVVTENSRPGVASTHGWTIGTIKALAVATDIDPPASPCGMCRQFIREFCQLNMPVFMFGGDGNFVVLKLEQLLPMSFGPEALPPTSRRATGTAISIPNTELNSDP